MNWPGYAQRECGEHRPLGPGYSFCYDCSEKCSPAGPCARCELPELRAQVERLAKRAAADHRGYSESRRTLRDYIERLEEKLRKH